MPLLETSRGLCEFQDSQGIGLSSQPGISQGAHQFMLLLHLGHALPTPLVPMLQLGHHCLTLLAQNFFVFNQL